MLLYAGNSLSCVLWVECFIFGAPFFHFLKTGERLFQTKCGSYQSRFGLEIRESQHSLTKTVTLPQLGGFISMKFRHYNFDPYFNNYNITLFDDSHGLPTINVTTLFPSLAFTNIVPVLIQDFLILLKMSQVVKYLPSIDEIWFTKFLRKSKYVTTKSYRYQATRTTVPLPFLHSRQTSIYPGNSQFGTKETIAFIDQTLTRLSSRFAPFASLDHGYIQMSRVV